MFDPWSFWKEASSQIRTYPCPACNETISADAASCRFCHLPIAANTAQQLLTESQRVTTAVARANTFSLSTRVAVLLTGFALFNLYMDRSLIESLVLCPLVALAYGTQWLYDNRSRVTHDADYSAAITKVKWTTMVWVAVLLVQLSAYIILNGLPDWHRMIVQLPQPLVRKIIHDGDNRPVLNMRGVTAKEFPNFPSETGETIPFPAVTLFTVSISNDGKTSARVTKVVAQPFVLSGDCDVKLFNDQGLMHLHREVPPETAEPFYVALEVKSTCKMSLVLKINVVYTNLASGVEYTQELQASPEFSLEYPPPQQK